MSELTWVDPDKTVGVTFRWPGWLKNELIKRAEEEDIGLSALVGLIALRWVEQDKDFFRVPDAIASVPDPKNIFVSGVVGMITLEPCGAHTPCERKEVVEISGVAICDVCRIRIT